MTDNAEPKLPPGFKAALDRHDQFGGFVLMQRVSDDQYGVLLGGLDKVLLRESAKSSARSKAAHSAGDLAGETGAACSAVLSAAAACEARLSEYLAHEDCMGEGLSTEMKAIRRMPNARDQWKELLRIRRPRFAPGSNAEYAALGCLYKLRDLVAHRAARLSLPEAFPDSIVECVRQRVVPARREDGADWTTSLFVYEVADWAAQTSRAWIDLVDRELPIHC
jgi:hypothetical protein